MSGDRGSERFDALTMKTPHFRSEMALTQFCDIFEEARGAPALFEGSKSLSSFSSQRRMAPRIAVRTKEPDENQGRMLRRNGAQKVDLRIGFWMHGRISRWKNNVFNSRGVNIEKQTALMNAANI